MLSETFRSEIDAFADSLREHNPLLAATRNGTLGPNALSAYIATLGYMFRHNVPALALAKEYALIEGKHALADYYGKKVEEERGHYKWAEQDLARLESAFGTRAEAPLSGAEAFLQDLRVAAAQNATSFLAYIVCTEYITVVLGPEWIQMLESRCSIPRKSVSAVDNHIELDKDHAARGLEMLDVLVGASDDEQRAIRAMQRRFMEFFESLTRQVAAIAN